MATATPSAQIGLYVPSGRYDVSALVTAPLVGCLAAIPLGAVYGFLIKLNPFVYINILATLGLGFLIGQITALAGKRGHVRNPLLAAVLGLISGVVGWYASWVVWVHAVLEDSEWFVMPSPLFEVVRLLAQEGVWSIKSATPTGATLWAIWTIEALVILGLAVWGPHKQASEPYCESCRRWAIQVLNDVRFVHTDTPDALRAELCKGNIPALGALAAPEDTRFTALTLHDCPACHAVGFFTVKGATLTTDSKGKVSRKENGIVENLVLTGPLLAAARRLAEAKYEPPKVEEDAATSASA